MQSSPYIVQRIARLRRLFRTQRPKAQASPGRRGSGRTPAFAVLGQFLALFLVVPAQAVEPAGPSAPAAAAQNLASQVAVQSAKERQAAERAACLSGRSPQDRATCLKEVDAALAESRRQGLSDPAQGAAANQRQRCDALPSADRSACIARMSGAGTAQGSVAGGGILRELRTPVPGAAAAPFMPASAASAAAPASASGSRIGSVAPAASSAR